LVPDAHYHYACDSAWWDIHYDNVKKKFNGVSFTINDSENAARNPNKKYDLVRIKSKQEIDLGEDIIHYGIPGGSNSGFQAINLAYMLGARTIILLGFDMCGTHYFGNHPKRLVQQSPYKMFIQSFETITKDIEIINCSRKTALNCFPKMRIGSVLL